MAGAGGQVSFTLSIPAEEFRRYYDGSAREVVATGHDGRVVRFPVRVLQRFLGHDGVHGEFLLRYDAQRKFVSLERLAGGS